MYIIDYLQTEAIFLNGEGKRKDDIIFTLLKKAAEHDVIPSGKEDAIFKAVMEREMQSSTGIGNGIAIPHCRTDLVRHGTIIAGTFPSGIPYHSLDNNPVTIVFLFIFPGLENKEYLQVLAKTARLLQDEAIRNKLVLTQSREEFRSVIAKNDIIPIQKGTNGGKYLFILALSDQKKMKTVISNLVEIGAHTSLIVDSETLEKKLAYDIPIFAGLSYFKGKSPYSKTFIGILDNSHQIDYLNDLLKKEDIDLSIPGAGFLLSIKTEKIIGGIPREVDI